jgi:hypothetical protein
MGHNVVYLCVFVCFGIQPQTNLSAWMPLIVIKNKFHALAK